MKILPKDSLLYHSKPKPGKLETSISKSLNTEKDLLLAYTPGVAHPVNEIYKDSDAVYKYTNKGNLVGVITNGSSVLGLGDVGALASKPVMEGKAVLFKKLANIDAFDIEIQADNVQNFIDTVCNISPTFGGINLEDIKAPECFFIEEQIKKRVNIPVFHDDQHGTAVVLSAALLNALELQKKNIEKIKIICMGAGAAAIASMKLLLKMGLKKSNIYMFDSKGLISKSRKDLNEYKEYFKQDTTIKDIKEIISEIDVFIGLSKGNILDKESLRKMPKNPIVFALANPIPEINPDIANKIRNDLIIATGRSDYPNQINNLICFPYIFRGLLDVNATEINDQILVSLVNGIRKIVKEIPNKSLYPNLTICSFGKDYIIPKPMDPRLIKELPSIISNTALRKNNAV
jgi:malate dehydrogenase (oxaloacetate-decarboxylating)(NADP+)